MDHTKMETFVWLEALTTGMVEWRYTCQGLGALLMEISGIPLMLRLPADSLATLLLVSISLHARKRDVYNTNYLQVQEPYAVHIMDKAVDLYISVV